MIIHIGPVRAQAIIDGRPWGSVDALLTDGFGLQALDAIETTNVDQLVVERHLKSSTIIASTCVRESEEPAG